MFEEKAGTSALKIGVYEYYIAKRAARKLKAFWQNYKTTKAREDAALTKKTKEEESIRNKLEEAAQVKRQATRRRKSQQLLNRSSASLRGSDSVSRNSPKGVDLNLQEVLGIQKDDTKELEEEIKE